MDFKLIKLDDVPLLNSYFARENFRTCDYTAPTLYLWAEYFKNEFFLLDDTLLIRSTNNVEAYSYPAGPGDKKRALTDLYAFCESRHVPLVFNSVPEEALPYLDEIFVTEKQYLRDWSDYLYSAEELIALAGKKYHGKRGHVKKFLSEFGGEYEPITETNRAECEEFLHSYKKPGMEGGSAAYELGMNIVALNQMEQLGLFGGVIRSGGKIVALSIGEILGDTLFVHIEKALREYPGAYETMSNLFLKHNAASALYVNREEDLGDEGLRQSKLSYKPLKLLNKYYVKVTALR